MTDTNPKRKFSDWWVITEDFKVIKSSGSPCPADKYWYFADLHTPMLEGYQAFKTEREALEQAIALLDGFVSPLKTRLLAIP
jgi:hypothetical protein